MKKKKRKFKKRYLKKKVRKVSLKKKKRKFKKRYLKKKFRKVSLKKKNKKITKKRKKSKAKKKLKSPKKTRKVILSLLRANEKLKSVFSFNFNLDRSLQNFFQGISNKILEIKEVIQEEKEKQKLLKLQVMEREKKRHKIN